MHCNDYETVGQKMYETHHGMSKLYEVSCEELDFLNDVAREHGVTGSRVMGGAWRLHHQPGEDGSTTLSSVLTQFKAKYGHEPKVYDVVISDGARKL